MYLTANVGNTFGSTIEFAQLQIELSEDMTAKPELCVDFSIPHSFEGMAT